MAKQRVAFLRYVLGVGVVLAHQGDQTAGLICYLHRFACYFSAIQTPTHTSAFQTPRATASTAFPRPPQQHHAVPIVHRHMQTAYVNTMNDSAAESPLEDPTHSPSWFEC